MKKKYTKRLAEKIASVIRSDTYTIIEVCNMARISKATFYKWMHEHEEFAQMVSDARDELRQMLVCEAEKSLLKKIQGYTVQEKHTTMVDSKEKDETGKAKPRIKEQKIVDKHFQPDTAAIIFTLTNRDPGTWKNKQFTEVTGKDGKDLFGEMTDVELDGRITELEKRLSRK